MKVLVVIPARYASTRFPGKPLVKIAGNPMVQHVYERCAAAIGIDRVIVATEDQRVLGVCTAFGGHAELTAASHVSGTDRVAEVAARHPDFDAVLNVQGDEPAMEPQTVSAVANLLSDHSVSISTAITLFTEDEQVSSPNAVKVVVSATGDALYFSRSVIPYFRNESPAKTAYFRHLGIYGFRRETLLTVTRLPPSDLERAESLEQLRWLEAGYRIRCVLVSSRSSGVDTPEDLANLLKSTHL